MTVKSRLEQYDKEKVVTIYDGYGWTNIDKLDENGATVRIYEEINGLFQD